MLTATDAAPAPVPAMTPKPGMPEKEDSASDLAAMAALSITDKAVDEPLLRPNSKRFVLFPIQYHDLWQAYKNAEAKFWSAEELEMSDDLDGFEQLSRKEQSFILQATSFLCIGHGVAPENLLGRFSDEIQVPEARCFFGFQIMQSNIHTELFTVLLDMFSPSEQQRDDLLDAVTMLNSHSLRQEWIEKYILNSKENYTQRIVALAILEGVLNTSVRDAIAFVAGPETAALPILDRETHLLPGLIHAVYHFHADMQRYISFAAAVKSRLVTPADNATVYAMVRQAVKIEQVFIDDLFELSGGTITICGRSPNKQDLFRRVEFAADACLNQLGFQSFFSVRDPLPWITQLLEREAKKIDGQGNHIPDHTPKPQSAKKSINIDQEFTVDADF